MSAGPWSGNASRQLADCGDNVILCEDLFLESVPAINFPRGGRHLQDAGLLQRIGRLMFVAEKRHKVKECAGVFSWQDERSLCAKAMLERVAAHGGFASGGSGAGAFAGVAAVSPDFSSSKPHVRVGLAGGIAASPQAAWKDFVTAMWVELFRN